MRAVVEPVRGLLRVFHVPAVEHLELAPWQNAQVNKCEQFADISKYMQMKTTKTQQN